MFTMNVDQAAVQILDSVCHVDQQQPSLTGKIKAYEMFKPNVDPTTTQPEGKVKNLWQCLKKIFIQWQYSPEGKLNTCDKYLYPVLMQQQHNRDEKRKNPQKRLNARLIQ